MTINSHSVNLYQDDKNFILRDKRGQNYRVRKNSDKSPSDKKTIILAGGFKNNFKQFELELTKLKNEVRYVIDDASE